MRSARISRAFKQAIRAERWRRCWCWCWWCGGPSCCSTCSITATVLSRTTSGATSSITTLAPSCVAHTPTCRGLGYNTTCMVSLSGFCPERSKGVLYPRPLCSTHARGFGRSGVTYCQLTKKTSSCLSARLLLCGRRTTTASERVHTQRPIYFLFPRGGWEL